MRLLTHRLATLVVASLVTVAVSVTLPFVSQDPSSVLATDAIGVFDPLISAQSQGPSVYGHVATDGAGNFYALHRVELPGGQYISVRKSVDDGRTWRTISLFQGSSGGATRPQLSVSGEYVAVAYIGGYCFAEQASICGEAPYLAVSDNAGASWSGPRRLDQQAFDVQVAQDSDRTWVAWERGGGMELRMTFDGGATWEQDRTVERAVTGQLAAGGGLAVLTYFVNPIEQGGLPSTWALVADLDTLAPTATPIEPGLGREVAYPMAAAAAGGRVHVVTRAGMMSSTEDTPPFVEVHSADSDGLFGDRVSFDEEPWSASIAAQTGTVAVAIGTVDGVTSVATSSDGGVTFSEFVPVTSSVDGASPIVELGLAQPLADKPTARFAWAVPSRFVDQDGDGFPDPANDTGNVGGDSIRVWSARTLDVTLDACASAAPEGRTIVAYQWTELVDDGSTRSLPLSGCSGSLELDDGERMEVRLDVTDSNGQRSSAVQVIEPRDFVIASLGDSVASGEGNPHVPGTVATPNPAIWQDRSCHRSINAGPAVAAARLEVADPHSSVTFVQLACSGAAVLDSPEVSGVDDPRTGGLIDQYDGQEPEPGSLRPSQVDQLDELLGLREVDALTLSIGANDTRFSDTLKTCIKQIRCDTTSTRTDFEARLATLPDRFQRLDASLDGIGVDPSDVHITEYFDPSVDHRGVTQMRCAVLDGFLELLDDDEARWASIGVTGGLNAAVASAAATHGWKLVGGLAHAFRGHGYCSDDPWIVRVAESIVTQSNPDGAFHPNLQGHSAYADALYRTLRSELLVPPPAEPADVAVGPQALGPLMVVSATNDAITVSALRDTGGAPDVLGSRLIDRVVSGPGGLGISGPPAVSRTAAIGSWTQLPVLGTTTAEQLVAQLALKPNVAVLQVEIVQAPRNERYLVAERETTVAAILDATIDTPTEVTVDMRASVPGSSDPSAPPGRPLATSSTSVLLQPGLNSVLLPADQSFELSPGEEPTATVTVHDPDGADPADDLDNELTTSEDDPKSTLETRPLVVQMLTTPVAAGTVECSALADITRRQVAFANEVLPVSGPRLLSMLSCSDYPPIAIESEDGIAAYINLLDTLARRSHVDVMVSVVPDGWMKGITGGAVGVAVPGRRGVMIEASASKMVLAHEIAHSFGVEHVNGAPIVNGLDVARRTLMTGVDYMAERTPSKAWTGPGTWDSMVLAVGPAGGVPNPPDWPSPLPDDFEFGGTIGPDGTIHPAAPVPGNTGSPRSSSGAANGLRMVLEQTSGGEVVFSQAVPLEAIGGMFAPDATSTEPLGWSYFARTTLQQGVTGVQFRLDGDIVQQYDVAAAPEVTVTAPVADSVTERGRTLTVSWTTTAGPDATATVLASQDGGGTFKPLAVDVVGTSVDIVVPRDIVDGSTIVRVVVQDGMVAGQDDSEPFMVEAAAGFIPEKVVAVRHDRVDLTAPGSALPAQPGGGLYTMNPDGTDFTEIVPKVAPTDGVGGMVPLHPDWRGDAGAIAFDGEVSGRRDLYVVDPDGSDRRAITNASSRSNGDQFVCADWHPNGRDLLSFATSGFGQQAWLQLVTVNTETGAVEQVGGWGHSNVFFPPWDIACPRWSDDGEEILISLESRATGSGVDADILVIDVTTLQSKYAYSVNPGSIESVAHTTWLNFAPGDDDRFLANRRLFSSGTLMVAELQDQVLFVPDPVTVPMPRPVWGTDFVDPVNQADPRFGSAGFTADGNSVWFTTTNVMFPTRTRRLESYGFSFWYNIETDSVGHLCRMPVGGTAATCYLPGGDGTPVDSIDDGVVREPELPVPSPATGIIQADIHPEIVGTETSPPIVIEDPATAPVDAQDPPPGDVDTPSAESPPAPGADDEAPIASPIPEPTTYVVPAGRATPIVLRAADGTPAPATITDRPVDGSVELAAVTPKSGDPLVTGADAAVLVTPASDDVGTFTFEVTPPGGAPVTVTVTVLRPLAPTAVDDTLTVDPGSRIVLEPGTLLANDVEPGGPVLHTDNASPLTSGAIEIVSVYGYDGGRATLQAGGGIELDTTSPTGGTFQYVLGLTGSTGTSTGTVTVRLTESPTSPPPDPPSPPAPLPSAPPIDLGLRFEPVSPTRLLDTRRASPVDAGGTIDVVVAGRGGVPADATAVALSVTADRTGALGYLTVLPCGADRPNTSNVNHAAGDTVANAVNVALGPNGTVCVFSSTRTDVIVDVVGYWSSAGTGRFTPVTPTRLVDSRSSSRVLAGSTTAVDVAQVVPAGASAAVLNVTAVDAGERGYLTAFPCGTTPPEASNLNVREGATVAVSVVAGRGADGKVCVFSSIATDLVVDVTGWLGAGGTGSLHIEVPTRLLDTRQGSGAKPAAGSVTRLLVPPGSSGELLNVTAVDPSPGTYVTVYACGDRPLASNVNATVRENRANQTIIGAATGEVCIYTESAAHLVVDRIGTFLDRPS